MRRNGTATFAVLSLLGTLLLHPAQTRAQWATDPPPPPTVESTKPPGRARVEITPVAGYQFGGGMSGEGGEISIPSAFMYGAMIDVWVRPDGQAEFLYTRQETSLEYDPSNVVGGPIDLGEMTVHEFQVGGTADMGPGRIKPYALATLGVTWFQPAGDLSDESRLAGTLGAGLRAPLNDRFGLRVEGRWIINWFHSSGTIFCGPGGCLIEASGDIMSQGAVSGGLSIGF
jgi:hypothetical protein